MPDSTFVPATSPADLDSAGKALWDGISTKWELRPDELRVLEDACREADVLSSLETVRSSSTFSVTVFGSQGQMVIHPVISELRQHRATLAALLRQLKLPDENPEQAAAARSSMMRGVANARWATRGGA